MAGEAARQLDRERHAAQERIRVARLELARQCWRAMRMKPGWLTPYDVQQALATRGVTAELTEISVALRQMEQDGHALRRADRLQGDGAPHGRTIVRYQLKA